MKFEEFGNKMGRQQKRNFCHVEPNKVVQTKAKGPMAEKIFGGQM